MNRYGITLAADMYSPKDAKEKLPAIAVSGPFGAVKEQCFGLYGNTSKSFNTALDMLKQSVNGGMQW